jgi:transcriptional regulator with XRE-family HTH domain
MPRKVAEWLRGELARRGWSHRKLALRSGVGSTTLSYIVRGEHQPTVESIVKIAEDLEEHPAAVLRVAGILPDLLPETTEEEEGARAHLPRLA